MLEVLRSLFDVQRIIDEVFDDGLLTLWLQDGL
jgi:hypothetical protein